MIDIQRAHSVPLTTARPPCPQCGAAMGLTRIEADSPGVDRRTFECARCQHIEAVLVAFSKPRGRRA